VGIAEACYPHPAGWTLAETANPRATLERMSVRRLTALFREPHLERPACEAAWQKLLGPIEFHLVWAQFSSPLVTPRDFKSAFRIIHRSLFLRAFNPTAPDPMCRLCRCAPERFSHIGSCEYITETFGLFVSFAQKFCPAIKLSLHLIFLGMRDGVTPLPSALSALRVIVWKFTLIAFTRVDTDGAKYSSADVWKGALRRFETRVRRYDIYVARLALRRRCAGDGPLDYARYRAVIKPLEGYDEEGEPLPRPVLASALVSLA